MSLTKDRYKDLSESIKLLKTNISENRSLTNDINHLNLRLDILTDFISTYKGISKGKSNERSRRLLRKIISDIEYYTNFIWLKHAEVLNDFRFTLAENKYGYNKIEVSVTEYSKVLIKGINNSNEFFIEFTDSSDKEEIQDSKLMYIVFKGKPIAKEIIGRSVGHKFNFGSHKYEVAEIFDNQYTQI